MTDWTMTNSPALLGGLNSTVEDNPVAGTNTVVFAWTANGTSVSTSALIMLARIPHGAIITNLQIAGWSGSADMHAGVGLSGESNDSLFVAAGGMSATATSNFTIKTGALPHTCSLSDDTQPRYRFLMAKIADGSSTVTAIIRGSVTYRTGVTRSGL